MTSAAWNYRGLGERDEAFAELEREFARYWTALAARRRRWGFVWRLRQERRAGAALVSNAPTRHSIPKQEKGAASS